MQDADDGTIQISPEEDEAIKRLEALGFGRAQAAQAYFACGKNEELAANFLFENPDDALPNDFTQQQ